MSEKPIKVAIIIGRAQPAHKGHAHLIEEALLDGADTIIWQVGSSNKAPSIKNPLSLDHRERILYQVYREVREKVTAPTSNRFWDDYPKNILLAAWDFVTVGLPDYSSNSRWLMHAQDNVNHILKDAYSTESREACLSEREFDITLYYHDQGTTEMKYVHEFPQWKEKNIPKEYPFHATDIRRRLFVEGGVSDLRSFEQYLPTSSRKYLEESWLPDHLDLYQNLLLEARLQENVRKEEAKFKYGINNVAGDAVVVCNGHILLVTRKAAPGIGQLAMPGGYLNPNETIRSCIVRELKEETGIALTHMRLKECITKIEVYDEVSRSTRSRIISHAALIPLHANPLPRVKGGDDAAHAAWYPLSELESMAENIFEDHYLIITNLLGYC